MGKWSDPFEEVFNIKIKEGQFIRITETFINHLVTRPFQSPTSDVVIDCKRSINIKVNFIGDFTEKEQQYYLYRIMEIKEINLNLNEEVRMGDKEKVEILRAALATVLDQVDYTRDACGVTEMVGAVLDKRVLELAHKVLSDTN